MKFLENGLCQDSRCDCRDYIGMDVRVKFGDSRSNGSRDIRGANFMSNERTYRSLSRKILYAVVERPDHKDISCLWKLPRHYGVPEKITSIVLNSYEGLICSVMYKDQLADAFPLRTSVRRGCFFYDLSSSSLSQLEGRDFADDSTLLSHTHSSSRYNKRQILWRNTQHVLG